jgi:hypothetical protein
MVKVAGVVIGVTIDAFPVLGVCSGARSTLRYRGVIALGVLFPCACRSVHIEGDPRTSDLDGGANHRENVRRPGREF